MRDDVLLTPPTAPVAVAVPAAVPRPAVRGRAHRQTSTFTDLAREVRDAGLLERRRGWYVRRMTTTALALAVVVGATAVLRDSWLVLLPAAALAVVLTQCAFLGHDGAHRQIFTTARANEWAGRTFAGLCCGLSQGWWLGKHTRHHQGPNQVGVDGDVGSKVLSFTPEAAAARRGALAWLTRRQGYAFFPLLPLQGLNLHVDSASRLLDRAPLRHRRADVVVVLTHWVVYLMLLLLLLGPGRGAAFLGVHLALFGVCMGGAFAPNHVGMPVVPRDHDVDFLSRQVLVSRNVRGGTLVDLAMGGLNFQVEHHLFPSMPRPHLRRAQRLVRAHCDRHGVTYTETSVPGAFRAVVGHLHRVGHFARPTFSCPAAAALR